MADNTNRKIRRPKKQKVKQGHKLVWLTLLIILIPVVIIGYVLLNSARGNDKPVAGNRYASGALSPKIDTSLFPTIQGDLMTIAGVENATMNLNSSTLRAHLNMQDDLDLATIQSAAEQAYSIINSYYPIDTYFTDTAELKNYDLAVDSYNYLVDENHSADNQIYIQITKNGPGQKVIDNLTSPKNAELAAQVRQEDAAVSEEQPAEESVEEQQPAMTQDQCMGTWYWGYDANGEYYEYCD